MNRFAALALVCSLLPGVAVAQPPRPTPSESPFFESEKEPERRVIPEINFDGTPLPEAIDFLREFTGENIVLQSEPGIDLDGIHLRFRVKNVTLAQVFELLSSTPGTEIDVSESNPDLGPKPFITVRVTTVFDSAGEGEGVSGVASLRSVFPDRSPDDDKKNAEEISALIDAAIKTLGDGGAAPKVYYHPGSRMVIFRGNSQQVELLTNIFKTMSEDANRAGAGEAGMDKARAEAHQMMAQAEIQIAKVEMRLEVAERERAETERELAKITALANQQQDENRDLRARLAEMEMRLRATNARNHSSNDQQQAPATR